MGTRLQVVFDATDPHVLVRFWAAAVRYDLEDHSPVVAQLLTGGQIMDGDVVDVEGRQVFRDLAACSDPEGTGPRLLFQRVPEGKTAKNRVHLDLQVGAAQQCIAHSILPAGFMLGQHDGQLDHVLSLQLAGRHAVQHIGFGGYRRGG